MPFSSPFLFQVAYEIQFLSIVPFADNDHEAISGAVPRYFTSSILDDKQGKIMEQNKHLFFEVIN